MYPNEKNRGLEFWEKIQLFGSKRAPTCSMGELLNQKLKNRATYGDFEIWWNTPPTSPDF